MPKLKPIAQFSDYAVRASAAQEAGEKNDCAVRAVSIALGLPYADVRARFEELGRKAGRATPREITLKVVESFGRKLRAVPLAPFMARYPKPHCNVLKSVSTHHFRRFVGCFDELKGEFALAFTTNHCLAVVDATVRDWTINAQKPIRQLYIVE